jgi:aspartate kinase
VTTTLVIKFGGTSLGTPRRVRRAGRRIAFHVRRGLRVVAVVSAAGLATDRLLARLAAVAPGARHGREHDRALATGEDCSAALLAAALQARSVPALSLTGSEAGVRAYGPYGAARLRHVSCARLNWLLDAGVVPVVSGFQGRGEDGETVTLGRGASDTTAVALAAALGAECHIVTDVDGVYDCDPRTAPGALRLDLIDHERLLSAAAAGARVVHADAARIALERRVPLRIYAHAAPPGTAGTRVSSESGQASGVGSDGEEAA